MDAQEPKLHIIVTPRGVDRTQLIAHSLEEQRAAIRLYDLILPDIMAMNERLEKERSELDIVKITGNAI